jgi:hypothetical protein
VLDVGCLALGFFGLSDAATGAAISSKRAQIRAIIFDMAGLQLFAGL